MFQVMEVAKSLLFKKFFNQFYKITTDNNCFSISEMQEKWVNDFWTIQYAYKDNVLKTKEKNRNNFVNELKIILQEKNLKFEPIWDTRWNVDTDSTSQCDEFQRFIRNIARETNDENNNTILTGRQIDEMIKEDETKSEWIVYNVCEK